MVWEKKKIGHWIYSILYRKVDNRCLLIFTKTKFTFNININTFIIIWAAMRYWRVFISLYITPAPFFITSWKCWQISLNLKKKSGFLGRVTICEPSTAPPEVDALPSAGSAALVSSSGTASSSSSSWHNTAINGEGGVRLSRSAAPCSNPVSLNYSKRSPQLNCCFSFTHILFKHLPVWHNTGTKDKFRLLFQNADDGRILVLVRDTYVQWGTACFYTTVHCVGK